MTAPVSRTIASIPRPTTGEDIRVSVMDRGSSRYVDLRVFAVTRSSRGEPQPTNAGLCLRVDLLDELIAALQSVEASQ